MPVINSENRDAWQAIANELSAKAPLPDRRVNVVQGRKHKGKSGIVVRNIRSRFVDAYRYASEAQAHVRDMARTYGYVVLVREDSGAEFWVDARYVEVVL